MTAHAPAAIARPVRVDVRDRTYVVVGSTWDQLRASVAALGPVRDGRRHLAFTDWEIAWRMPADARTPPWSPSAVLVSVEVTVTLPDWHAPRAATPLLPAEAARRFAALRRHEYGHVAIATRAARAVAEAFARLPPAASRDELERATREAAAIAVAPFLARERDYDARTRHGVTQGAFLGPDPPARPRARPSATHAPVGLQGASS